MSRSFASSSRAMRRTSASVQRSSAIACESSPRCSAASDETGIRRLRRPPQPPLRARPRCPPPRARPPPSASIPSTPRAFSSASGSKSGPRMLRRWSSAQSRRVVSRPVRLRFASTVTVCSFPTGIARSWLTSTDPPESATPAASASIPAQRAISRRPCSAASSRDRADVWTAECASAARIASPVAVSPPALPRQEGLVREEPHLLFNLRDGLLQLGDALARVLEVAVARSGRQQQGAGRPPSAPASGTATRPPR